MSCKRRLTQQEFNKAVRPNTHRLVDEDWRGKCLPCGVTFTDPEVFIDHAVRQHGMNPERVMI